MANTALSAAALPATPHFQTRGVVITPADLTLADWPERAQRAGLTTIALHPFPGVVKEFIASEPGRALLERCRACRLEVEYELHAVRELLPRAHFAAHPEWFRMDDKGDRTPDTNCCVHSKDGMQAIAEAAVAFAEVLRPTTGRYFYWGDDGKPWCRCPACRDLSDSDQALLFTNHLADALRKADPRAQVAHLAYANTLSPPAKVAPHPHVFLEFAPIRRDYTRPLDDPEAAVNRLHLELLDANLEVFRRDTAQVLEYWLDCSMFSEWKEPHVKLPWRADCFAADIAAYGGRGIRHITTFAVYLDAKYVEAFGPPPLDEYGQRLAAWPGGVRQS